MVGDSAGIKIFILIPDRLYINTSVKSSLTSGSLSAVANSTASATILRTLASIFLILLHSRRPLRVASALVQSDHVPHASDQLLP